MTDSRAALEEAARQKRYALVNLARAAIQRKVAGIEDTASFDDEQLADFAEDYAEQESSSLKLLLSAMCKRNVTVLISRMPNRGWIRLEPGEPGIPVELDSSGIPVITEEILKALEATK